MNISALKDISRSYNYNILSVAEAVQLQKDLQKKVVRKNSFSRIDVIAGADISILKSRKKLICGIVVYTYPELMEVERKWSVVKESFPYIPGLLAFREVPAIIETLGKVNKMPDLLVIDGHGVAHPRGIGIASQLGVIMDLPTIGVAKKKLYGEFKMPGVKKGSRTYLLHPQNDDKIGVVYRTKDNVKPVFISSGNNIDLETSVKVVMKCDSGFRIPVPTRAADKYVSELRREMSR